MTDSVHKKLNKRRLYLCSADRSDLEHFIDASITGGVDVVQFRDKHLETRQLLKRAKLAQQVCLSHGVPFIINDRPDIAFELGADGVHLGQQDMPVSAARKLLGQDAIIGLSTHQESELEDAQTQPVNYISAGPVVATPTKPGRAGTGNSYISLAINRVDVPVYVTGGVDPYCVPNLVRYGAQYFVVVRWLTQASDPLDAARKLKAAIDEALAQTKQVETSPGETSPGETRRQP